MDVDSSNKGTELSIVNSVSDKNDSLTVEESYEQVKELIEECLKK